jgi:uncharacterized membrane protein
VISGPLPLVATLLALVCAAFWLEARFSWARAISASLLIIALGAAVSNLGLVAASSPVYDAIWGPVTSLAIVWLLLAVDLRDLKAAGPAMLAAFGIAVVATATGALVAAGLWGSEFPGTAWKLAGVMTGTYSGGSLNFVGVGRAVDLPESLFAAATAADNIVTAVWMGATLVLPFWLRRYYPARDTARDRESSASIADGSERLVLLDLSVLLLLGFALLVAASAVGAAIPAVPEVIWLTTLSLLVAQLPPVRRLRGAFTLGTFALNLFFAVIGIGSRVAEIAAVGWPILYLTVTVVAVHGLLLYGVGRLARIDVETLSVASQAAVGGPSTAMALAVGRGWSGLVLPGLAVGLLGYAVGNYAGLTIAWIVRQWLGG